jgi:phycocyanobilin:ferredoxin oxidoreductase
MSNFISGLSQLADQFECCLDQHRELIRVETAPWGWHNARWIGQHVRVAHVEKFVHDKFAVVHVCVFPSVTDPSPIFGFDIIAGAQKATGLFFDLSPTVTPVTEPFCTVPVSQSRQRPEWGDIFSPHWIAVRPDWQEFAAISQCAVQVLDWYLQGLGQHQAPAALVAAAQNHYCRQQKQNTHTVAMLTKIIGGEAAQRFVDTMLFPEVVLNT